MAVPKAAVKEFQTKQFTRPRHVHYAPRDEPLPLESGDHLTRAEFERRYAAMPHIKKAELIEGVVYMPSLISNDHSAAHAAMAALLGAYFLATPKIRFNDNASVRLDWANEVQPDLLLRLDAAQGGQSQVDADNYIQGAPELVVEIAASSVSYDLHEKLNLYQRSGVREYLVWQIYDNRLDWFEWREGQYVPLEPDAEGVICSRVFPGLHLAVNALLEGDLAQVSATLQRGLESEAHAAFVARL